MARLLTNATQQLEKTSTSAVLDAELLLAFCMQKDRSYLLAWTEVTPLAEQQTHFQQLVEKRLQGIPIAYLLGTKAFWTLELIVSPAVLIPRPETEHLVEVALEKIRHIPKPKILDLGTGSGAIALALATERPDANIIAADASATALTIAQANKNKYQLDNVQLLLSDWFDAIPIMHFDLIVSNPPYIESNDPHLQGDIHYEPQQALTSGVDGLDAIRTIVTQAKAYLKPDSFLILEHGYNQGNKVRTLLTKASFNHVKSVKDYAHIERLSLGS
ncbi:MAG TPA: peptide chain release factor N(5)-glutamine methyltransferase [Thiothrix sp.]|nr:peptide chain release factor N(5)-glutamine methyltransferase [Thiothrix sp.]